LIFALGIRHVGERVAQLLADAFGDLQVLATATTEALQAVPGIGPTVAVAISEWFARPENTRLVAELIELGLTTTQAHQIVATGPLTGATLILTGRLDSMTRGEAEQAIKAAGGAVGGTVTKKTTAVVAGEEAGSKLERARTLKVPIWTEADLLAAIAASVQPSTAAEADDDGS
jgi:DNA ligase (NAD+)